MVLILSATGSRAKAQLSGAVSVMSDDRFRGQTVSHARPALQAGLSYDDLSGLYLGAAAAGSLVPGQGPAIIANQVYAGFAKRVNGDVSIDLGAVHARYTRLSSRPLAYTEAYLGAHVGAFSSHIRFSPDYFGSGRSTLYIDADFSRRFDPWLVSGHLGQLARLERSGAPGAPDSATDWRIGVSRPLGRIDVQLSATGNIAFSRAAGAAHAGPAVSISASLGF